MSELLSVMALPASAVDEFEAWWLAYPRKIGKPAARRAWLLAVRRTSVAELAAGLAAYEFDPERKFQPHPATWLNQDRWRDAAPDLSLDPWGLGAWHARQSALADGELFGAAGYALEALAEVLSATALPVVWRGDLDVLGGWLSAGYRPDSVAQVVGEVCARMAGPPRSLASLDRVVRWRATRWDPKRMEWSRPGR